MSKDALKFFQAYLKEMIEIGGPNFPKSISTELGAKLAKIYKERGIYDLENGLRLSYQAINANPKIERLNQKTFQIVMKYPKRFCPIGGKFRDDIEHAEMIQNSICFPYTYGFLNELDSNFKYKGTIKECILKNNRDICHYLLELEEKTDIHD
ncbi:MAG: hypothetical protein ACFE85_06790 [Candidatus Hodarchaeota archaeon]